MADIQTIIRSIGPDGKEVISNIIDQYTGDYIVFKETDYIPSIIDGVIFIKDNSNGKHYKRVCNFINPKSFGAKGDYNKDTGVGTDDTIAIQKAFDLAGIIKLKVVSDKLDYLITNTITIKYDIDFNDSTFYYRGNVINTLLSQSIEADIINLNLDGTNVNSCQYGLFINTNYVTTKTSRYIMNINNIKNIDNTQSCNGAVFYKASGQSTNLNNRYDISISCDNIIATANSIIGDSAGASTGVLIGINSDNTEFQILIRDFSISNIFPVEDSAGVQILTNDYRTGGKGIFIIENGVVKNVKKRAVKIQSPNTIVRNITAYCDDTTIGFDTYSNNTTFDKCVALNCTGTAFNVDFTNTLIKDCEITTLTVPNDLSLVITTSTAKVTRIDNLKVSLNRDFLTNGGVIVRVASEDVYISNTTLITTKLTGSFISVASITNVFIDKLILEGLNVGINIGNNTSIINVTNSKIKSNTSCITKTGASIATVNTINCEYESLTATAINLGTTSNTSKIIMNSCTVKCITNGILAETGSKVKNSYIEKIGAISTGFGINFANGVIDGNRVINFTTGISYTFSTSAEVTNNTCINCTAAFNITGVTKYIDYNNIDATTKIEGYIVNSGVVQPNSNYRISGNGIIDGFFAIGASILANVKQFISTGAIDVKGLVIRSFAGQTANLFEVQASSTAALVQIDSVGNIITGGNVEMTGTAKGVIFKSPDGTRYRIVVANGGVLSTVLA